MSASRGQRDSGDAGGRRFATTRWSLVAAAAGRSASPQSSRALATLCEGYWFPLYAFVRREGYSAHDAQDLTQEFFARLLDKNYLADADRRRGRFRSFLLASLKHFLSKQRDRARAQKRGGGRAPLSLDFASAESRYHLEPAGELTAERLYDRRWALTVLEQVLGQLRNESAAAGKLPLFDRLKQYLTARADSRPYAQVADELAMTEGAVKVAVHRLRRRYRELLKQEIAQTVTGPEELDDELRHLFAAVGSPRR